MPWTADEMRAKGARKPDVAAGAANDALARLTAKGVSAKKAEVSAIRIGLWASNRGKRKG
jgi:hypothetical protein